MIVDIIIVIYSFSIIENMWIRLTYLLVQYIPLIGHIIIVHGRDTMAG